jgi:hypothetical protein
MWRGPFAALILTVALVCAQTASADNNEFLNGNELYRSCTSKSSVDYGQCVGYIEGVSDQSEDSRLTAQQAACMRKGAEAGQVKDVVVNYLNTHPARAASLARGLRPVAYPSYDGRQPLEATAIVGMFVGRS